MALRVIVGLLIVQTAALILLVWSFSNLADRIGSLETERAPKVASMIDKSAPPRAATSVENGSDTACAVNPAALQWMVTNAVKRVLKAPQDTAQDDVVASSDATTDARTEQPTENDRHQQAQVADEIDQYITTGSISPHDMHDLQAKIAKLNGAARKRMLRKLIMAMNDGSLKGRL